MARNVTNNISILCTKILTSCLDLMLLWTLSSQSSSQATAKRVALDIICIKRWFRLSTARHGRVVWVYHPVTHSSHHHLSKNTTKVCHGSNWILFRNRLITARTYFFYNRHAISNQIKSNLLLQKGQLATNNANIKTV